MDNNLLDRLAKIAESQVGAEEFPRGSNRGPALAKYFAADNYQPGTKDEGYAWCAAFVSWCVQQWLREASFAFGQVKPPRRADAFGFKEWGAANGAAIITPSMCKPGRFWPARGDIVIYTFSHVGIVSAVNPSDRIFTAIEGNSNDDGSRDGYAVVRHGRTFAAVREFVRITPRAEEVRK